MNFEYKASEGFEGGANISLPKYVERLKYIKECNFKVTESGEVEASVNQIDSIIKMIEIAEKHIISVNITHIESGAEAKSFDELQENAVFDSIVGEIASAVINGGSLGKN